MTPLITDVMIHIRLPVTGSDSAVTVGAGSLLLVDESSSVIPFWLNSASRLAAIDD